VAPLRTLVSVTPNKSMSYYTQ